MTSIVPNNPFTTVDTTAANLRMTMPELAERVSLLDIGDEFGPVQMVRWVRAATDGEWTAAELLRAVDWLNVHHSGFVKIAHVHDRIEKDRNWFRAARMFCYRSNAAFSAMYESGRFDQLSPEQLVRIYEDDPQAWRAEFEDATLRRWDDATWLRWIQDNATKFRGEA